MGFFSKEAKKEEAKKEAKKEAICTKCIYHYFRKDTQFGSDHICTRVEKKGKSYVDGRTWTEPFPLCSELNLYGQCKDFKPK